MKQCPQCGTKNWRTNLFCPMCGNSFIPEPEAPGQKEEREKHNGDRKRRTLAVIIVVVVALVLAAGLASFLISREIVRSQEVVVESGTRWRCTQCGKIYEKRVLKLVVQKRDRDKYKVETVPGKCYTCQYGKLAGEYQDFFEQLSEHEYFHGYTVEMKQAAAQFIAEHPDILPASSEIQASALATEYDPSLLAGSIDQYAGKPMLFKGKVVFTQVLAAKDNSKMTYLQFAPLWNGKEVPTTFQVFYPGVSDLLKGDTATVYMLPVDVVRYGSGNETRMEPVGVALFIRKD